MGLYKHEGELTPHYGAFDNCSLSAQVFFRCNFLCYVKSGVNPRDATGANSGGFDTIGLPYIYPEGRGGGGGCNTLIGA